MNRQRYWAAATSAVLAVASLATGAAPAAATDPPISTVSWQPCPVYSDETLAAMMPPPEVPRFKAIWARAECGIVEVPVNYREPNGRRMNVAITRLRATDQARRLGVLAVNPGGPGGSGYLMPVEMQLMSAAAAKLNERYDLIGFDPRGVGYSTKVNCPEPAGGGGPPPSGPMTEEQARAVHADMVTFVKACAATDTPFISQLTTTNVARDLDRVRAALGERQLNFFGVSWGTWLGVVYRSLFPEQVGRMWLDSVAIPDFTIQAFEEQRAAATERHFRLFAAWVAKHGAEYGFGRSEREVAAALPALKRRYDTNPVQFDDLPRPIGGNLIMKMSAFGSDMWPDHARALQELRDATGPLAPPKVKELLSRGRPPGEPPADAPERGNPTANFAMFCNEDTGPRGFEARWASYQQIQADNPMTGGLNPFTAGCSDWLPGQEVELRRSNGSLVLVGHRYETMSVYEWTKQTRRVVGGTMLTVNDDVHGSVLFAEDCAAKLVDYFNAGRTPHGTCQGIALPA